MKKDSATGVAAHGDSAIWARASRPDARAPEEAGAGVPPAPRGGERWTLVLPVQDVLLRAERFPTGDPGEIAAIAANRMEAESPLEPEEMVFSHEVLERSEDASLVLCAAAPVAACAKALAAATGSEAASGASLVCRVDCAAAGLARSLAAAGLLAETGRQPILAMDGDRPVLLVVDGGRLVLARAAGSPASFPQTLRLALIQAEMACGPESSATPLLCLAQGPEWLAAAQAAATAAGRECSTPPLDAKVPPAVFGAALRTLEGRPGPDCPPGPPLDLFPATWRAALDDRRYKRLFVAGAAAAFAVWVALVGALWGWPAALGAREAALQREADSLAPAEGAVRQVRERIRLIDRYSDRTFSPLEILREISLALPDGVTLKQMAYEAARRECTVEGEARGSAPAYDFSNRLKSSPLLARNDIVSGPTENRNTGKTNFRIRLSFATPDGEEGGGGGEGGAP